MSGLRHMKQKMKLLWFGEFYLRFCEHDTCDSGRCEQRVIRPRGGINEWLRWLPVSLHKMLESVIRRISGDSQLVESIQSRRVFPSTAQNGGGVGLSSILEADVKKIASIAHETFEK